MNYKHPGWWHRLPPDRLAAAQGDGHLRTPVGTVISHVADGRALPSTPVIGTVALPRPASSANPRHGATR